MRLLVDPVSHWSVQVFSVRANLLWELAIKLGENVVERKSVSSEMYPARIGSKNCQCLTWPETVAFRPIGNIGDVFLGVSVETAQIKLP